MGGGGGGVTKRHFQGKIRHFDVAERYFNVHFQHSFFSNNKPFRPCVVPWILYESIISMVVLSRPFVCKILPDVCGSVCECS